MDEASTVARVLSGRRFRGIQRHEYSWVFEFDDSIDLTAECPWRILSNEIVFTDSDHGQQFGLPAPLDGQQEVVQRLCDRIVERAQIREVTGDLSIEFTGRVTLELLNLSGGYEAWQLSSDGTLIVAQGGGKVLAFSQAQR